MRLFILYIVYGVMAIVAESTWLAGFPADRYQFDLLLIAVAYLGFSQEWRRAFPIIIVFGVFYDAVSAGPFGIALCSYMAIYGVIRLIITKIAYQSVVARFAWVAMASVLDKAITALLLLMWGYPLDISELILARAPIQALIDSFVALVLIPLLSWYSELRWSNLFRPKKIVIR